MKFFRRPLGKKKPKKGFLQQQEDEYAPTRRYLTPPQGSQPIKLLPDALIERIFTFVCPHTQDETYETCEQAAEEQEGCMLCDLRDLSHCAKVSRKWRALASKVMYHSIRIDAVHYCRLEEILAEKRKRKSKFNRNGEPENIPQVRLQLLSRTLRENVEFGPLIQYLKIPIMTRETSKADLARTVAVLPNLKYVDLPDGFFTDESSCHTLKQELQGRCPDIRKMTFAGGGERSLESLATAPIWRSLEVLELTRLNMDPTILRQVLGYLPLIRALKVTDMKNFNDELLEHSDYLPPFPALTELIFQDTPNVTADGLSSYLFRTDTQSSLTTLSLTATGVHPSTLQNILCTAPALLHLSITETVTTSFPASSNIQPLASDSLRTFHYEITSGSSANAYANTTTSYYAYLTSSLLRNGLPNLHSLYVRDPDFPESLIDLAPPIPAFAHDPDNFSPSPPKSPFDRPLSTFSSKNPFAAASDRPLSTFSSNNPFASNALPSPQRGLGLKQPLEVYSKGLDEMEWNFATVQPPTAPGRRGSMTNPRPISSYGLAEGLGKQWAEGGGARRSVIVGNGFGGYLAVPAEELQRPSSSAGEKGGKPGSRYDMWR